MTASRTLAALDPLRLTGAVLFIVAVGDGVGLRLADHPAGTAFRAAAGGSRFLVGARALLLRRRRSEPGREPRLHRGERGDCGRVGRRDRRHARPSFGAGLVRARRDGSGHDDRRHGADPDRRAVPADLVRRRTRERGRAGRVLHRGHSLRLGSARGAEPRRDLRGLRAHPRRQAWAGCCATF